MFFVYVELVGLFISLVVLFVQIAQYKKEAKEEKTPGFVELDAGLTRWELMQAYRKARKTDKWLAEARRRWRV